MSNWTTWTGNKNFDWNQEENWSQGIPGKGRHAIIPAAPTGGDYPRITGQITIEFTLKNNGIIDNEGSMLIKQEGIIQNDGQFINREGATISNRGIVMNNGRFINEGTLHNSRIFTQNSKLPKSFPSAFRSFFEDEKFQELNTIR